MSDDQDAAGRRSAEESALSRRTFLYGSTAAAAGALAFGRVAPPARAIGRPRPPLHPAVRSRPLQGTSGFSFVQAGAQCYGSGSVTVTLGTASSQGTLLIATLLSGDPTTAFTAPSGWRQAKAVTCGNGRAEIWYYPGTPPSPGNPGKITSATFTSSSGTACRGAMSEFTPPAGTGLVVLDAPGQASGSSGGTFSLTAAAGNIAGDLGIAIVADFFGAGVSNGSWTAPSGWTEIRHLATGAADPWAAWYEPSLPGTAAQSLTGKFSITGEQSWAFAFAAFRAITFAPLWLGGGEMATMVALDPTGQDIILGGDVEGFWRTADFGDHWQLSQDGLYGQNWRCTACVAWSQLETGRVYACVGKNASASSPDGGFLASTDGGLTWSMRSTDVQFQGNAAGSPPRPGGEPQDADRSTGDLLAQDAKGGYLYAATYDAGVYRSSAKYASPVGTTWEPAGLSGGDYYVRTLVMNPSNNQELWAGVWAYSDPNTGKQYGGVYHCTTAQTASGNSAWSQVPGLTATVADLKVIGGYLYAACPTQGIYRYQIGSNSKTWTSLNGGPVPASGGQLWTSLDGYVDGSGNHQIVACCGFGVVNAQNPNCTDIVQITITSKGAVSYTDLTGQADINLQTVPPDGRAWWKYNPDASWPYWLGGKQFVNPHILIDPNKHNRIYVAGAGGFFRTDNADADPANVNWTTANNGMPMYECFLLTVDPTESGHLLISGSDLVQIDLTDATGWDPSKVAIAGMPVSGTESHATTFDPSGNVFTGVNTKYEQNTGGAVYWRAAGDSSFTWYDTGYSAALDPGSKPADTTAPAPIGIFAGVDGNTTYLVVVTQGADVWRAVPGSGGMTGLWTWTQLSTGIGTGGNVAQHCPIVAGDAAGYLYCFDRAQGLYRSADYGQDWTQIWAAGSSQEWPLTVTDGRSGWLAVNPNVDGELWVAASNALYKLNGVGNNTVGTGIKVTAMPTADFPNGAGGVAFNPANGTVYAVALNGTANGSQPPYDAQLMASSAANDGSSWTPIGGSSFSSYASWPGPVAVATDTSGNTVVLAGTDENFAVYGIPSV